MSELLTACGPDSTNGHTARRLATRQRLLDAGTELFAEVGVRGATTTSIARRAGVATGTFYLHFPDKHALFEVLVDDALTEMREQLHPTDLGPDDVAAQRARIEAMLEVAQRRRSLIRAVFDQGEPSGLADRIQDRIASGLEPNYEHLFAERGIERNAGAAAQARAATMVRVIAWWAEDPARASSHEIAEILLELDPLRVLGTQLPSKERTP